MVDMDKNTSYSAVRIVSLAEEKSTLILTSYPNPVVSDLRVTIPAKWKGKEIYFELVNSNGQTVKIQKNASAGQTESIAVSALGRGIYFVKAYCGSETAQQRILKN
jgi:Secretion system C-terminal sorting domain